MTDILHITDRERAKDALIRTLESARDEMAKRIEALTAEAQRLRTALDAIVLLHAGRPNHHVGDTLAQMAREAIKDKP